jgi:hypothetical protein
MWGRVLLPYFALAAGAYLVGFMHGHGKLGRTVLAEQPEPTPVARGERPCHDWSIGGERPRSLCSWTMG